MSSIVKVSLEKMTEALEKDMYKLMNIKMDVEKNLPIWYYIDPNNAKRGPFRTDEIFTWRKQN